MNKRIVRPLGAVVAPLDRGNGERLDALGGGVAAGGGRRHEDQHPAGKRFVWRLHADEVDPDAGTKRERGRNIALAAVPPPISGIA